MLKYRGFYSSGENFVTPLKFSSLSPDIFFPDNKVLFNELFNRNKLGTFGTIFKSTIFWFKNIAKSEEKRTWKTWAFDTSMVWIVFLQHVGKVKDRWAQKCILLWGIFASFSKPSTLTGTATYWLFTTNFSR